MAEFNKKPKYNFWHSPIALGLLFCLLVLFSYNMIGLIQKERETSKNKASELSKIEELRQRQAALSKDIDKLNTDQGVEESIRDKFQVAKPGEKMVVIVDDGSNSQLEVEKPSDHSLWGFIKKLFGN